MDDGPAAWFALADTQWRYGRLLPEVKEIAINLMKEEPDLNIIKDLKFLKTTRSYGKAGKWYTRVEDVMSILLITEREAKRFKTKVIMKDPKYKNPPERIAKGLMIGWNDIDYIDEKFVREFKIAEEKGILRDETK